MNMASSSSYSNTLGHRGPAVISLREDTSTNTEFPLVNVQWADGRTQQLRYGDATYNPSTDTLTVANVSGTSSRINQTTAVGSVGGIPYYPLSSTLNQGQGSSIAPFFHVQLYYTQYVSSMDMNLNGDFTSTGNVGGATLVGGDITISNGSIVSSANAISISGPLHVSNAGAINGNTQIEGVHIGVDSGGNASIEMVSSSTFSILDFKMIGGNTDYDGRIL